MLNFSKYLQISLTTFFITITKTLRDKSFFIVPRRKGITVKKSCLSGSRWLPTAAARVCVLAGMWVCGEQSGTGVGFLRVLRFPLPIIIPIISSSS
jgi:hypothetical protein